jgi:hypothetical protein
VAFVRTRRTLWHGRALGPRKIIRLFIRDWSRVKRVRAATRYVVLSVSSLVRRKADCEAMKIYWTYIVLRERRRRLVARLTPR